MLAAIADPADDGEPAAEETWPDTDNWVIEEPVDESESVVEANGTITVQAAADMVIDGRSMQRVFVIYSANCPRSQRFFPVLADWLSTGGALVEPFVFTRDDLADFDRFNSPCGEVSSWVARASLLALEMTHGHRDLPPPYPRANEFALATLDL